MIQRVVNGVMKWNKKTKKIKVVGKENENILVSELVKIKNLNLFGNKD
jgi:hypothetical protein